MEKATTYEQTQFQDDLDLTLRNRESLSANRNLLYWYQRLYAAQMAEIGGGDSARVLEIGSGVSPMKRFFPQVITSDVLPLDYVDHVFDCHEIDRFPAIEDASLDGISLTNVLHHLQQPLAFFKAAASKLKSGGAVIAAEPFMSGLSRPIYRHLHHEPADETVTEPTLAEVAGPLASSNQALPYLIFCRRMDWLEALADDYAVEALSVRHFTSLAYFASGGISRRLPGPHLLYKAGFAVDELCARLAPRLLASFMIVTLRKR